MTGPTTEGTTTVPSGLVVCVTIDKRHGAWWISFEHGEARDALTPVELFDCAGSKRVAMRVARRTVEETMPGLWSRPFRWIGDYPGSNHVVLLAREVEDDDAIDFREDDDGGS